MFKVLFQKYQTKVYENDKGDDFKAKVFKVAGH